MPRKRDAQNAGFGRAAAFAVIPSGILETIEAHYPAMSPGQRAVATYILHNPATFCFLPIQELAAKVLVSHSTVVRFCKTLGYKGFYEFSRDVQQVMQAGLSSVSRFDMTRDHLDAPKTERSLLRNVLDMEIQSLMAVSEHIKPEDMKACVDMMAEADNIFVIGLMASLSLAVHTEQLLSKVAGNVHLVPPWSLQAVSMLQRVTSRSVLIAFAFPRYPTATVDFTTQAKEKRCSVIAITNSHLSPLAKLADQTLYVPVSVLSYVDLYGAPVAVSTALALEFSNRNGKQTAERLLQYDKMVVRNHLFTR